MSLKYLYERPGKFCKENDIDVDSYLRIYQWTSEAPAAASGVSTFVYFDIFMSEKARNDSPGIPIKKAKTERIVNWVPTGKTLLEIKTSIYKKLAPILGVNNIKL